MKMRHVCILNLKHLMWIIAQVSMDFFIWNSQTNSDYEICFHSGYIFKCNEQVCKKCIETNIIKRILWTLFTKYERICIKTIKFKIKKYLPNKQTKHKKVPSDSIHITIAILAWNLSFVWIGLEEKMYEIYEKLSIRGLWFLCQFPSKDAAIAPHVISIGIFFKNTYK